MAYQPILRECSTKLDLLWFSTVRNAAEAERRQFRKMLVRLRGIPTLLFIRFLPNLGLLMYPFIGTGS